MSRKNKLFALLIAVVLCVGMFSSVTVFALPEDETYEDTTPYESEYVEPETEYVPTEPETEYVEPETEYVEPETEYVEPETEAQVETDAPEQNYYEDNQDDYDYGDSYNYEERESNTTNERAETAAVYDAEKDDVSTETLKKSDWAKIAEQLKNSSGDDGDDFAFIRKNDPNSGNTDDWYIIVGIALEALGVGLVTFLIIFMTRRKKAIKAHAGNGRGGKGGGMPPSKDRGAAKGSPYKARTESSSKPSRASRATKKQRSKFDTAEIAIPKHTQRSGGTRYKPKH